MADGYWLALDGVLPCVPFRVLREGSNARQAGPLVELTPSRNRLAGDDLHCKSSHRIHPHATLLTRVCGASPLCSSKQNTPQSGSMVVRLCARHGQRRFNAINESIEDSCLRCGALRLEVAERV